MLTSVNMSPNERKLIIHKTISKNENIGANELLNKIISKHGNIISKPTFFKYLYQMEEEHKISIVKEDGRQDVIITTYAGAQDGLRIFEASFDKIMASLEQYFQMLRQKASRLSDDDKAAFILSLIRMIQFENWVLSTNSGLGLLKMKEMENKLDNFRHKVYHFIIECSPKKDPTKIFGIVSKSYLVESKILFDLDNSKLENL
ncbi:MAG: hypothetical protein KGL95_01885 [Patescibacteria group bacterium]|nr:hypothetical protein [Patescibacteria group bacterium]